MSSAGTATATSTMWAAVAGRGQPGVLLTITRMPRPEPRRGEVLIQVMAAGVNRADVMQCRGHHPPPAGVTPVLGLECAGTVVAVGPGTSAALVGRRVCALLSGGGYAEFVAVPADLTLPIPDGMSFTDAAALPEAVATAWSNLFLQARLRPGERVLVHAGTGGVGTVAIQLAAAVGAEVSATARTPDGVQYCLDLGADDAGLLGEQSDVDPWWSRGQFDVVLDLLGGPYLQRNLAALARRGRLAQVGLLAGSEGTVDLECLLRGQLTILGSGLRMRPDDEKALILREVGERFWSLAETGEVGLPVDAVFPFEQAEAALARVAESGTRGRVVLGIATDADDHHRGDKRS